MRKYKLLSKKGEGTFSEVFKAQNVSSDRFFAIKCMKRQFTDVDQVNNLREIQALRRLSPHPHIVNLEEVLYDKPSGRLALVFELLDATLLEVIQARRRPLSHKHVAAYMYQLLRALEHMHTRGIFHRDIKPENVLLTRSADGAHVLKVADYGSCRGIYSRQPYTEYISTRWYRSPEVLLTDGYYAAEMDIWATGCVMFETVALFPLFPGNNELDMISRIHHVLGTPPEPLRRKFNRGVDWSTLPQSSGVGIDHFIPEADPSARTLIGDMVKYDTTQRVTAEAALAQPFFRILSDVDKTLLDGLGTKDAPTADATRDRGFSTASGASVGVESDTRTMRGGSTASGVDTPSPPLHASSKRRDSGAGKTTSSLASSGTRRAPHAVTGPARIAQAPAQPLRDPKKKKKRRDARGPTNADGVDGTASGSRVAEGGRRGFGEAKEIVLSKGTRGREAKLPPGRRILPDRDESPLSIRSLPSVAREAREPSHGMREARQGSKKGKMRDHVARRRREKAALKAADSAVGLFPPIQGHAARSTREAP